MPGRRRSCNSADVSAEAAGSGRKLAECRAASQPTELADGRYRTDQQAETRWRVPRSCALPLQSGNRPRGRGWTALEDRRRARPGSRCRIRSDAVLSAGGGRIAREATVTAGRRRRRGADLHGTTPACGTSPGERPPVPAGLPARRRPVRPLLGDHPRRPGRLPEHLPPPPLRGVPRRPAPPRTGRADHRVDHHRHHHLRPELVHPGPHRPRPRLLPGRAVPPRRGVPRPVLPAGRPPTPAPTTTTSSPTPWLRCSSGPDPASWSPTPKAACRAGDRLKSRRVRGSSPTSLARSRSPRTTCRSRSRTSTGRWRACPSPGDDFLRLTRIPVVVYYGDNIPSQPSDVPAQDFGAPRCRWPGAGPGHQPQRRRAPSSAPR